MLLQLSYLVAAIVKDVPFQVGLDDSVVKWFS